MKRHKRAERSDRGLFAVERLEERTLLSASAADAQLLAHWTMDDAGSPYADAGGQAISLNLDLDTAPAQSVAGADGNAARLSWQSAPGVSTRLASYSPTLQTDSFGFSFWVRPEHLSAYENLIGKEMQAAGGADFTRVSWQVHLAGDNGSGWAPVELVVRGADRTRGDFFGNVFSTVLLPLHHSSDRWYHIAGGYDAGTGRLSLHVNGAATSADGAPGAFNSDGGAVVVGSMVNGPNFVAYAAMADVDEVQVYDAPLSATEVAQVFATPGRFASSASPVRFDGNLVAHWKLDELGPWYGDGSGHGNNLLQDHVTSAAVGVIGVDGPARALNWQTDAGVTTRLYALGDELQTDSFGFSFWINPTRLAPYENLIAKETSPTAGPDFARIGWQVQVGPDNGDGFAPLELVVRGSDRSQGDYFGSVRSAASMPLFSDVNAWVHVAGGYDAETGALSLYVDGVPFSAQGRSGADHSDGSWISIGTVRNGTDFVGYGAVTQIDDVQLYDGPLSEYDAAILRRYPGRQVNATTRPYVTSTSVSAGDDLTVAFNSIDGWHYRIDASTPWGVDATVGVVAGTGASTTATISRETIDRFFGPTPISQLSLWIRPIIADPIDGSIDLPPADIRPFANGERYVPQYHFSWPDAPVGDPDGVLRYENQFHLFTWDHAVSADLVTWAGLGWPMRDGIADSSYWTGTVVVDTQNTSGFGSIENPPMVAIYTIHNNVTGKETIGVSYSTNHRDFYTYAGNPVASTDDLVFRDPDVFWDEQTNRWIMLVARSEARAIRFYASNDLKSWEQISEFSAGLGARTEIWEVPGLVEVPIRGEGNQSRWVLYSGAGANKVQYWVGDFDGTRFTVDPATHAYLRDGVGLDGDVFASFEAGSHWDAGWTYTGAAFGNEPAARWHHGVVQGYLGDRVASSYVHGDWLTGSTLTSHSFTIAKNAINFLIAGGNHPGQTCINLIVDGQVVRSTTGDDSDILKWAGWDVSDLVGRTAQIQIVDDHGGFWGRIYVDQITFSDVLMNDRREHALWVDFGSDFFAPRAVRDYDGASTGATWLGWIGNWQYESSRPDPDTWGKGAESIFRDIELMRNGEGYRLVQTPIDALQKLRGPMTIVTPRTVDGVQPLNEFQPATNTYELEAVFDLRDTGRRFGLNLAVNDAPQRLTIGYDTVTGNLYLDRTSSGYVTFGEGFHNVVTVPYKPTGDELRLRIFIDQSSIEVFVNDGERVLTSQIYPDPSGVGVQLFSHEGSTLLRSMKAWMLASIWDASTESTASTAFAAPAAKSVDVLGTVDTLATISRSRWVAAAWWDWLSPDDREDTNAKNKRCHHNQLRSLSELHLQFNPDEIDGSGAGQR